MVSVCLLGSKLWLGLEVCIRLTKTMIVLQAVNHKFTIIEHLCSLNF